MQEALTCLALALAALSPQRKKVDQLALFLENKLQQVRCASCIPVPVELELGFKKACSVELELGSSVVAIQAVLAIQD